MPFKTNLIAEDLKFLTYSYTFVNDIDLSYYYFLQGAIDCISYNKQLGAYNINKLEKFLNNSEFRKKYGYFGYEKEKANS